MSSYFLIGGAFQDVEGNPMSKGWLTAELTAPATDSTTTIGICNAYVSKYLLDSSGNIVSAPAQPIWPTDIIQNFSNYSFPYYYRFTGYNQYGALVWGPNYLPVTSVAATSFVGSEVFVGNGAQQVYVLSEAPLDNALFVYYNGVLESNYTLSGTSVTFTFVPDNGSHISFYYYFDQTVSPVFVNEAPEPVSSSTQQFQLGATPVTGTLLLYRSSIDSGGLLQHLGVDYSLFDNFISLVTPIGGDKLWAIYQTSTEFTTSLQVTPSGVINGVNNMFALPSVPISQSLQYFWNGLEQTRGIDYTVLLDNVTISMTQAPQVGDNLVAFYNLNAVAIDFNTFVPTNPA